MKSFKYSLLIALFVIIETSCTNIEEMEMLEEKATVETVMKSRSGSTDYSSLVLLPKRTIMPREGQSYYGYIAYNGMSFETAVYWDFDIPDWNLYAAIGGTVTDIRGTNHHLSHVNTYKSASNTSELNFIIQCIYSQSGYGAWPKQRYITFHLSLQLPSRECYCTVLEDTEERWPLEDLN